MYLSTHTHTCKHTNIKTQWLTVRFSLSCSFVIFRKESIFAANSSTNIYRSEIKLED